MKNYLKIAVAALALLCTTASFAQNAKKNQSKQKATPEQIATAQAQEIAYSLGLNDATTAQFVTTFVNYRMEIREAKKSSGAPKKISKDMSDKQVEEAISAQFANSHKVLEIREKYYKEYRKFLNPRQIQRVYELEKRQTEKLKAQKQQRKNNKKKKNNK